MYTHKALPLHRYARETVLTLGFLSSLYDVFILIGLNCEFSGVSRLSPKV